MEQLLPTIIFIHPAGERQVVDAVIGASVMRAAVANGIDEITAECGGAAACATCHVYVEPRPGLPLLGALEDEMLDTTAEPRRPTSRLGCQIFMTAELDGLEVGLPDSQT